MIRTVTMFTAAAIAVAACSPAPSIPPDQPRSTSTHSPAAVATRGPTPSPSATPAPTQTPTPTLTPDAIPGVAFDPLLTTTVCDASVGQVLPDVDVYVACADGLELALASILTVTQEPIARMYLSRPPCAEAACADVASSSADVTAWESSEGRAWHVTLTATADAMAVSIPLPGPATEWPAGGETTGGSTPAASRPAIPGAPSEIAKREPLPLCGVAKGGDDPVASRCLITSVIGGRPAELLVSTFGTEGDPITLLYRYLGHGALVQYEGGEGAWHRTPGSLIPNPGGATFSFDQWVQGGVAVTDAPAQSFVRDGWGEVRGTVPAWWTLPGDALKVDSDTTSVTYAMPDAPDVAMAYVTGLVGGHGFTTQGREADPGSVQARFTDGTTTCSVNVRAVGTPGGTRLDVLYPVGCPWR